MDKIYQTGNPTWKIYVKRLSKKRIIIVNKGVTHFIIINTMIHKKAKYSVIGLSIGFVSNIMVPFVQINIFA